MGWVHGDQIFGPVLHPFVAISVGILLFDGGLSLRWADVREVIPVVRNLIMVGVLVTWVRTASATKIGLGFGPVLALLLGAILAVGIPTVITPLLNHVRPTANVARIIRSGQF